MFLVKCPWCGERDLSEFGHGGEGHIVRPKEPENLSDEEWGDYIFFRKSPKGVHYERWVHTHGCRRWFNAVRDTVTDQFLGFYKSGEQPPEIEGGEQGK